MSLPPVGGRLSCFPSSAVAVVQRVPLRMCHLIRARCPVRSKVQNRLSDVLGFAQKKGKEEYVFIFVIFRKDTLGGQTTNLRVNRPACRGRWEACGAGSPGQR